MKKIIFSVLAIAAFGSVSAQDKMSFGVKGGVDMVSSKYSDTDEDGGSTSVTVSATGFFLGGFVEFGLTDKISLEPGLNYHTASKDGIKFDYLSIPVLGKYQVADKFKLMAGPSLFYSLDSDDEDKTRFNVDLGASYNFTENFFLEPRYSAGLTGDVKVSHFLVAVGYKF